MTTTFAPGRSARSGFLDRARSAIAGLDWILLLGVTAITVFGLFVTPVFYTVIRKLGGDKPMVALHKQPPPESPRT